MTLYKHVNGDIIDADQTEQDKAEAYNIAGKGLIRTLISATTTFSVGLDDWFGEAYTSSTGRNGYVTNTIRGDASLYNGSTSYYSFFINTAPADTTHDPNTFTNPTNAFDNNLVTAASKSLAATTGALGKTFTSKTIKRVYVKADLTSSVNSIKSINLQSFDGATWTTVSVLASSPSTTGSISFDGTYDVDITSVQGIRIMFSCASGTCPANLWELKYTSIAKVETTTIEHTIPGGTFPSGITKAFLTPLIALWETGADIQYKLTSGVDDSGWLLCGTSPIINAFTAFTNAPTKLIVRLIPKVSSPTINYPGIYGFAVRCT